MAGSFGDAEGVRALGQALLSAGRGLSVVTGDLSGNVHGLIPSGWSGAPAETFGSDWNAKAHQAAQLAAVCTHVGQALTGLADQLDAANRQATQAQQMTGGPASRFALPSTEQKSQQLLSHASGAAQQARAAARAKLAGIAVPKIGSPLTASQVTAWAGRLAPPPKPSRPWYETLWHGAESDGLGLVKGLGDLVGMGPLYGDPSFGQSWAEAGQGLNDFAAGFVDDGLLGTAKGLGDLVGMGPLYGDPSFAQTWDGMGHLVEPWNWSAFSQSWEGLGKGLLAWDEWKSDPARAAGQVLFNVVTLPFVVTKALDAADAAATAARAARAAKLGETADKAGNASKAGKAGKAAGPAGDVSKLTDAQRVQDIVNPGGKPIGVPGSPGVQVVGSQQDLQQIWVQIKTALGRPPDKVIKTPKGLIDQYNLGDGKSVQYRSFSKSGGDTIDIKISGQPIKKIHVKS